VLRPWRIKGCRRAALGERFISPRGSSNARPNVTRPLFRRRISATQAEVRTRQPGMPRSTICYSEENLSGYRMGEVNSRRERCPSERAFGRAVHWQGQHPLDENGAIPGLFRTDHRAERLSAQAVLADGEDSNSRYPIGRKLARMNSRSAVSTHGHTPLSL
jgi:hypothetical protein